MKKNKNSFRSLQNKGHTIKALKKENQMLRAEIRRLDQIIKARNPENNESISSDPFLPNRWCSHKKEALLLSSSSYAKYLVSKTTGGSLFALSKQAMGYFRKFRLVSAIIRVISSTLAVLGTGAFFIFLSGAVVFIVPFIIAFCASIYFLGTIWRAQAFRMIEGSIKDRQVYVLFPDRERAFFKGSAFEETLHIISNDTQNQNFLIIVSPYVFSSAGFSGDVAKFYPIARYEKNNVCILRKHSLFLLRKKVLGLAEDRTTYIY